MVALAFFGVFSLIAAFATAPAQIVALRFLIGLGMGGATPSLLALTAEYSPHKSRGTLMTVVLLGLPGGALIGGLVAAAWLPLVGGRGVFLVGGITPMVLLLVCVWLLPESPGFLAASGKPDANAKARQLLERITGRSLPTDAILRTEVSSGTAKRGSVTSLLSLGIDGPPSVSGPSICSTGSLGCCYCFGCQQLWRPSDWKSRQRHWGR